MKTTQLYEYHRRHAKLTEFAGYDMPLWYTSTTEEHMAVRERCGIFDVSHMGRFAVEGKEAGSFLEKLVPTGVQSQPSGKSFYTLLLNEDAGIIDDLIIVKLSETDYVVVVNAANAEADMKHMRSLAPGGLRIEDMTATSAMVAVQGPAAQAALQALTPTDLGQLKRFGTVATKVLQQPSLISRTGYTGEDGFEVILEGPTVEKPEGALAVWEKLAAAAAPCGLSARDSLRLEAGFPLHGNDIDSRTDPLQSGLSWVLSRDKTGYVGWEAIARLRESPPPYVHRGAVLERGIPRHGFEVLDAGSAPLGTVTSGSFSPVLKKGIALTRVRRDGAELGAQVKVKVRDSAEEGKLVKPPFYDETRYGWKRAPR